MAHQGGTCSNDRGGWLAENNLGNLRLVSGGRGPNDRRQRNQRENSSFHTNSHHSIWSLGQTLLDRNVFDSQFQKVRKYNTDSLKRKLDICERHIRVCETVFSSAEDRRLFVCYPAWSRGAISNANTECHGQKQPKTRICKICAKICLGMWMPCFSLPTRDFVVLSWVLSHAPAVMPLLLSPSSCPPAPPLPPAECQINWSRVLLWCGLMLILRCKYLWLLLDFILWQTILWPVAVLQKCKCLFLLMTFVIQKKTK